MYPERLKRARKAAGLSLRALGERIGVSQTTIKKYEDGINTPNSSQLIKLAKALGVRAEYFFRPFTVKLDATIEYRKRPTASSKLLERIRADVEEQAERWKDLANLYHHFPIQPFTVPEGLSQSITSLNEVEKVAELVREKWKLGEDPLNDLVDVLETQGILIIFTDIDAQTQFDGLAASIDSQPVIVVAQGWSGDRQRFTLAHELGHLLLHDRLEGVDTEKACNRFAGAFLLPMNVLKQQVGLQRQMIEWQELYLLKHEFGISMSCCLFRLKESEIITKPLYESLQKIYHANNWDKKEPGDTYPAEATILFKQLVYRALAESWIGESKAAELLGMPLARFHRERKLEVVYAVTN